jgi:hypothetical protein
MVKIQVQLPEKLRTRFKAKCVTEERTMNQVVVGLVEAWTEGRHQPINEETEGFGSFKELVRQRYFDLMNSGKVGHQRLKELSFGQAPTAKERQIISEVLGLADLPG